MGYCGSGGSGRRKALMDKFQQFLENIDESRAVCPESPCGNTGPCASFGHTGHTHPGPVSTFNPPRAPDYLDPNKRPLITNIQKPICPVMDPRCPASFVAGTPTAGGGFTGSYNIGGGGFAGGYTPCANGYGMEMGMGAGMGAVCPATAYTGTGAGPMRASPCTAAILERERQERERQEREIRERMERERIERERKELDRREKDLRARKPYMCPGQHKFEEEMLKAARKAHLAGIKPPEKEKVTLA